MKNELITIEEQLVIIGGVDTTKKVTITASKTSTKTTTTITFSISWF